MKRLTAFLLLISTSLYTLEDSNALTNFEGEPCAFIEGIVNAITGDFTETATDLVVPGAEPLILKRFYSSSCHGDDTLRPCALGGAWALNHGASMYSSVDKIGLRNLTLRDANGVVSHFEGKEEYRNPTVYLQYHPEISFKGMTNCAQGKISGRTNLKNTRIVYGLPSDEEDDIRLHARVSYGSGKTREFVDNKEKMTYLPNGNQIVYEYDEHRVKKVKTVDAKGKKIAGLTYNKLTEEHKKTSQLTITASDNRTVEYHFKRMKNRDYLEEVIPCEAPPQKYKWEKNSNGAVIVRKECPEGRFLAIDYYDDTRAKGRVKRLYAPVGTDDRAVITHRFSYALKYGKKQNKEVYEGGVTTVQDAADNCTQYAYNEENRLIEICRCEGEDKALIKEKFYWGLKGTPDYTNLLSRVTTDLKGNIVQCRAFNYDANGNVLKERLAGNITGKNTAYPQLNDVGRLQSSGCDCYQKEYTYSDDSFNLMLSESDGRKKITYVYYPKRELLQAKFVWDQNKIVLRTFYGYDSSGSLIYEIQDDGSTESKDDLTAVTERRIKRIKVRTEQAPIGFPAEIEEKCLDLSTGAEKLLHRVINEYSSQGKLIAQDHYDSESIYLYTLRWEYDAMGNVITETDPLGHATKRKYDGNNLLIFEQGPRSDFHKEYAYDYSNRLIREDEVFADGAKLSIHNKYNLLNQKIASYDVYGHETRYVYNALGKLIEVSSPVVINEFNKVEQAVVTTTYDVLGYPLEKINANKKKTEYRYTILGKPYHIVMPDGLEEKHEYSLDGLLIRSTGTDGVVILCDYDYQGRLTQQEWYSPSGKLLKKENKTYNAFHLLSQTDGNGTLTHYFYDCASRMARKTNGLSEISFEYDSCSRIAREIHADVKSGEKIVKVMRYDNLNRVIEEYVEGESAQKVLHKEYGYDECGNRAIEINYGVAGKAITAIEYDPHGKPVKIVDPEGNITKFRYEYKFHNNFNQAVGFTETTDPMGNRTQEIQDAMGRIASIKKRNTKGILTQQCDFLYDLNGNQIKTEQTVITPNAPNRKVATGWTYDACNRMTSVGDALGDSDQKITRFSYNGKGQKEAIYKPNGVQLWHEYDEKGRLNGFKSSDNSFHYLHFYDANDNCVKVDNLIDKTTTKRVFDANNSLTEECLGNGLSLHYEVNGLERVNKIILPDTSAITYGYEGPLLKEVTRLDSKNAIAYSHHYLKYDEAGHVLQSKMIGEAGTAAFNYDLHGRTNKISCPAWAQEIPKEGRDKVGNIVALKGKDSQGSMASAFSYDSLYQLTKESGVFDHTYVFDSISNRVQVDDQKCKVNSLNQLLWQGDNNCKYDANGNPIEMVLNGSHYQLAYDGLDRLISFTKDKFTTKYTYDFFDRRLAKNETRFFYYNQCEIGSCDSSGKIVELRLLGIGKGAEIGAAVALELKGTVYAPIHNMQGSLAALMNAESGKVVETYRYTAFGEETVYDAAGSLVSQPISPWRFSSKRVDQESGFVNFGRRYYEPSLARWLTKDPKGYDAGPNLYAYVMGNPILRFDLWGLEWTREGDTWVRNRPDFDRAPGNHPRRQETDERKEFLRSMPRNPAFPDRRCDQRVVGNGNNSNVGVAYFPGIYTSDQSQYEVCQQISESTRLEVHNLNVHTCGPGDFGYHFLSRHHFKIKDIKEAMEMLKGLIDSKGGPNANPTILALGHSNGAMTLHRALERLPPEYRNCIIAFTAGGAKAIPDSLCKEAYNYLNQGDHTTFLGDPKGYVGSMLGLGAKINIMKSDQTTYLNRHGLTEGYSGVIEKYTNRIKEVVKEYANK